MMAIRMLSGVIVGASSLLGRELVEELEQTSLAKWDLKLLASTAADPDHGATDPRQVGPEADDDVALQPVTAASFAGADVVFFAGDQAATSLHWKAAHEAGASIVDLTGALEDLPGVLLRSGWSRDRSAPNLTAYAASIAHPAALMLALTVERLHPYGLRRLVATVLEPASQQGSEGVDELQKQAVAVLSFKPLEQTVFDAQVVFNMRASLGGNARASLTEVGARVVREVTQLTGMADGVVAVQVLQAPVFHGSTASVFVELDVDVEENAVRSMLQGDLVRVAISNDDLPTNESIAGEREITIAIRAAEGLPDAASMRQEELAGKEVARLRTGSAFWLWMAADNLRLTARSATFCAAELAALRPGAAIQ
jgi:aspartate-semialdehyde dehydrogenase